MCSKFRLLCLTFLLLPVTIDSARILGIFPMPSISHQVVFRALMLELAKRGHEVVIVTPDPALPKDRPPDNVTEIDVSFAYEQLESLVIANDYLFKRGVIVPAEVHTQSSTYRPLVDLFVDIAEQPELKTIVTTKQHFDLVIAEAFLNYHLVLSAILKAPLILFSSFHGFPELFDAVGAVARHPTLFPSLFRDSFGSNSVIDKFSYLKFEYDYYKSWKELEDIENDYLKKNYGKDAPTVQDLMNNVDLLFVNSHPIFCNNRPVPPNTVFVGPLHLQPLKEIPKDLKHYLDNSKNGVIYVSLGTNVRTSNMDKDLLEAFRAAFAALPYDILWKLDDDNLENLPKNVKIQKWFPQRDLLVHPNIKLFVTQGGLQSTDEAIDAEVPVVGIPMIGDQYYNVNKYVELGIGVQVDAKTMTTETLLHGINTVLNDDSYEQNMKKLKYVMKDNPQTPLERAVWWTEHIIRHGGGKHLRPPTANISWSEYLLADVILAVVSVVALCLVLVCFVVRCLGRKVFGHGKVKQS